MREIEVERESEAKPSEAKSPERLPYAKLKEMWKERFGCSCEGALACVSCAVLDTVRRHHGLVGLEVLLGVVSDRGAKRKG